MAMTRRGRRLVLVAIAGVVLAVAAGLILYALQDRIVFFNTPTEIRAERPEPGRTIRLGGLVAADSVEKAADGHVSFAVTDGAETIQVRYQGVLPDLFREGQGVVAEGTLEPDGVFSARTVLAKHDENYIPRELVEELQAQGVWQGDAGEDGP